MWWLGEVWKVQPFNSAILITPECLLPTSLLLLSTSPVPFVPPSCFPSNAFQSSLLSSPLTIPLCSLLVGNLLSWKWHVPCLYNTQLHSAWITHSIEGLSMAKTYQISLSIFLHFLFLSLYTLPPCSLFHCLFSLQQSTTLFCISLSLPCINLITPAWEERIIGT